MQEGVSLVKSMNPALVKAAIEFFRPFATEIQVTAGVDNTTIVTPLRLMTLLESILSNLEVIAGAGLVGGGNLDGDVTLSVGFAELSDALDGTIGSEVMSPVRTREVLDQRPPGIPVKWLNSSGGYTALAADKGYLIGLGTGYSGDIVLPDTLPQGFAISFFNNLATSLTVTTSGTATIIVAGTGATGSKSLAAKGMFTAVNTTSSNDLWLLSGAGIS
jgi:hypothetical protein